MNDPLDFTGKQVLVVGGSTGIGNGIARGFLERGAAVHVTGTRPAISDYTAAEGGNPEGLDYSCVDFSDPASAAAWDLSYDSLDALVLCQGTTGVKLAEFEMATFRKVIEVNLNSMMDCAMRFKPALKAAGGSIIMVSSGAAYRTLRGNPAYTASKSAILGLTRSLAMSFISDGIRVNGLGPGMVKTKLSMKTVKEERLDQAVLNVPIRRFATLEEMAGPALFLASPLASYVVGATLMVDGGIIL